MLAAATAIVRIPQRRFRCSRCSSQRFLARHDGSLRGISFAGRYHFGMNASSPADAPPVVKSVSGRWTVAGIFAFGVCMVTLLWAYWELHTRPFRPLQYAIADEFPDSQPTVIGGKHKSHKLESKSTLRIIVRVDKDDFDPVTNIARREERATKLYRLAKQHLDLSQYEILEIHLTQRNPEKEEKYWSKFVPREEYDKVFAEERSP